MEVPNINIIGQGTEIKGDVSSLDDIRIDGKLRGNFSSNQKLVVGTSGIIEGDITCKDCDVFGKVGGNMYIAESLVLKSTADVYRGTIFTNKLVMEMGAHFSGICKMQNAAGMYKTSNDFFEASKVSQNWATTSEKAQETVAVSENSQQIATSTNLQDDAVDSPKNVQNRVAVSDNSQQVKTAENLQDTAVDSPENVQNWVAVSENSQQVETPENLQDAIDIPKNSRKLSNAVKKSQNISVAAIFKVYDTPLMTGKDDITIKFTEHELKNTLHIFKEKNEDELDGLFPTSSDEQDWKIANAKKDIDKTNASENYIKEILYRPFDYRFTYYTGKSNGFHVSPQFKVCKNMLFQNRGLLLPKQISNGEFHHAFCTKLIPEMGVISTNEKETNLLFPLYLYPNATLTSKQEDSDKEENFTSDFRNYIDDLYGKEISPEQILGYIYAVLYSKTYRSKYRKHSKDRLAHIPFTENKIHFERLAKLGQTLIDAHLLETQIDLGLGKLIGKGSYIIDNVSFTEEDTIGKIHINETQYFNDVPADIWNFQIGEYQIIDTFFSERKGRELSSNEVDNIEQIINVIAFTLTQMTKIETITEPWI